jgi:CRP/FNR family transcriptional regulator, cyclic AMP receptor protein
MANAASESSQDGPWSGAIARLRGDLDAEELVRSLESAPLFSVLHPSDLMMLARKFHVVRYDRGEMIFREGEPAERLFMISDGQVKLSTESAAGAEHIIAMLGPGQIFGELAVIDRGPRAMNARAMGRTTALGLPSEIFWTMLESRPALARRLLELMARRLRRADQTSQDLVFFDAVTRLARKLLELAEDYGEPTGAADQIQLRVRLTQAEMAQMIGLSRSSVNRLIASFVDRGWLDWNRGSPILLRPESILRRSR